MKIDDGETPNKCFAFETLKNPFLFTKPKNEIDDGETPNKCEAFEFK